MTSNIIYCTMLCTLLFSSCKRQEIVNEKVIAPFIERISQSNPTVSITIDDVTKIARELDKKIERKGRPLSSANIEDFEDENGLTPNEEEIRAIINPLVEYGKQKFVEIKGNILNTPEWYALTENERNEILSIGRDAQFVDLALIFSVYGYENTPVPNGTTTSSTSEIIHDCIGVALGLSGIKSAVTGIFTIEKGISLLKVIGKRYLSYAGVAWMIWDFVDCVAHFTE